MADLKNEKVLVTGGSGFLGGHVVTELFRKCTGAARVVNSKHCDLRNRADCRKLFLGWESSTVIHLAGTVGGIGFNRDNPGRLFYENMIMGAELMEAARLAKVKKFVMIGTVCAYPKFTPVPFKEEDLWSGFPEETNAPYGVAKRALLTMAQAYRQQYGFKTIYLLPVNLYGPGDNFDSDSSHVIPALIRKVVEAKKEGKAFIRAWGTGKATREFLYVKDAAEAIVLATEKYEKPEPVNLGSGMEISIKELTERICQIMKFSGEIRWDATKPDGQPRRCLDISRAEKEFGFKAETRFEEGLQKTIDWYLRKYHS